MAESKWLTEENFNKVYEAAASIYQEDTKPDKTYENAGHHKFTMSLKDSAGLNSTKGNASFAEYLEAKLQAYRQFVK